MLVRLLQTLGTAIIAVAFGGLFFLYLNESDAAVVTVARAATAQVQVPADLETPGAVQAGAHLFRQNCVSCHGAPDIAPSVQGLTPAPPNLLAAGRRNDPAEVFSKVKNGIRGTAMPAWGDQISDQSIWALAAFLHHSRGISVADFDALSAAGTSASQQSQ